MNIYNSRTERGTEVCRNVSREGKIGTELRLCGLNPWPLSQHISLSRAP